MIRLLSTLIVFAAVIIGMPAAQAATSTPWQSNEQLSVRLLSGVNAVGDLSVIPLGLEVKLAPEWDTYWRSPGDAGMPPNIDWLKSQPDGNIDSITILYPAPHRFTMQGLDTFGYSTHVIFPLELQPREPGKPVTLDARVDILVCKNICIPHRFDMKLALPTGAAARSDVAALIDEYRAKVPRDSDEAGLKVTAAVMDVENGVLTVDIASEKPLQMPDVFVETSESLIFSAAATEISPDTLFAEMRLPLAAMSDKEALRGGLPLTLTVTDGDRSREQKVDLILEAQPALSEEPATELDPPNDGLLLVILFALIGGFILNLMPCVLPVLSLKILSVISHGGGERATVRRSFLTTSAGIVFSFLVLAGMMIALKAAGLAVGWGVQFQQPLFIVFLCVLLVLFAANLWELLGVRLPYWLSDQVAYASYHPRLAGDFTTGAFATLLATPCTAPFLGTAIGFALAAGTTEILLVFFALGTGMALPYLLIAWRPGLATLLPRPGHWITGLRRILGLALIVTAAWLLFVLSTQASVDAALAVAACLGGTVLLLAAKRLTEGHVRRAIKAAIALLIGTCFILAALGAPDPAEPPAYTGAYNWHKFDEEQIPVLVGAGKTVFVDVTASWCLTCKANKRFVLDTEDVREALFADDVVAMEADWTNPDPAIAAYLKKHKRYGIPFNVVYGPGSKRPILLPELLTESIVLKALKKARAAQ
ncbi:MAG: copper resistance protein [Alphaproteobacteria bacterium]|nr:copper resistance protein [Alphaproteobacteria bacterium]